MDESIKSDWDPRSEEALREPLETYDEMRGRCPVAHSDYLGWSLFRQADVLRVLHDHDTFSNAVSAHTSVPNGMDPPVHTGYRGIIEPYFSRSRMEAFEPVCEAIAERLIESMRGRGEVELMEDLAHPFALEVQCAFTGWSEALKEPLRGWIGKNHRATLSRDRALMGQVAAEFEGFVQTMIEERRDGGDDAIARLMGEEVDGRPLTGAEITSILRNWTVGELGTIAASVGILVWHLVESPSLQERLRAEPARIPDAVEEILRKEGPLLSNRRLATREVELGGRRIEEGARITLMWASANRDERVFEEPHRVDLDRDQEQNLLWGAGIHVCPGAPLARLELRVLLERLLQTSASLESGAGAPERAIYPTAGFARLPIRIARA